MNDEERELAIGCALVVLGFTLGAFVAGIFIHWGWQAADWLRSL